MSGKQGKIIEEYLLESLTPSTGYYYKSSQVLYKTKTPYQELEVHELPNYGRILRLDGIFQTSENDEFLYHEPLVHVPSITMNGPKNALIIGGGDGGAAEEILKYQSIKKVVMVELDEEVVKVSREYFPGISGTAFESPRMNLLFEDGVNFVKNCKEKFDLVVLDLTDPIGPSAALYTKEFYSSINKILNPKGALSLHIESPVSRPEIFSGLYWTLKSVFKNVAPMLNHVPLYGTLWGFAVASQELNPATVTKGQVRDRLTRFAMNDIKLYDERTHFTLQTIPKYIQEMLDKKKKPYTRRSAPHVEEELEHKLRIARI